MSMNWNIRYEKLHTGRAKILGREVFAIGWREPDGPGRAEAFMCLDSEHAALLWHMALEIDFGKTPDEAFEAAKRKIAEHKAKVAMKAAQAEANRE